ncbi:MAG: hypothetical protein WCO84_04050 [bacterium]
MINLLPTTEKNNLKFEYRIRFFTVLSVVLSFFIICISIPLVISYVYIGNQVLFIDDVAGKIAKDESFKETSNALMTIKDVNRKTTILNTPLGVTSRSDLMSVFSFIFDIADKEPVKGVSNIKINEINYEKTTKKFVPGSVENASSTESGLHKIYVKGKATDRESFLSFVKKLEVENNFASLDSPVSNLVNSKDINFYLTITLKDKSVKDGI